MLAPLLKEVGIALGRLDDALERLVADRHALSLCRVFYGSSRGLLWESSDFGEVKKSLGVRLRLSQSGA